MITLAQLLSPVSEDEVYLSLVTFLSGLGFQATSWQDGSIQKTLLKGFANKYSALTGTVTDLAGAGYPDLARGNYQRALGEKFYKVPIVEASPAIGEFRLALSSSAAPAAWNVGELVFADAPVAPANTFRAQDAGALAPGGSGLFTFAAEIPGQEGNIPPGTTLYMWTPITGMSATCPVILGTNTWLTTPGQAEEDPVRYGERMVGRFDRLTYGNTEGAYKAWALEALPALTRSQVFEGDNEGDVKIVGATSLGPLTAPQCQTIKDYIEGVTDGKGRRPINDVLFVVPASTVTLPGLVLTVSCDSAFASTCAARVTSALLAAFGTLPLGGEKISPSTVGFVYASTIYRTVMGQQGVRNVTGIPGDIVLSPTDIYLPAISITVVAT